MTEYGLDVLNSNRRTGWLDCGGYPFRHVDLSRLGSRAAVEAEKVIAGLGDPVPSVTKARSVLRHEWQPNSPTAQNIETAVQQLLSG